MTEPRLEAAAEALLRDHQTLVALLGEHIHNNLLGQCSCGYVTAGLGHRTVAHRAHLADVLLDVQLANGGGLR